MDKIRIAVFGISDAIWEVIKDEIDPGKAEIVLFIDNDETKQGLCYMNIPVTAPSKKVFKEYAVDACLITALSAYRDIERQLMGLGVPNEQIHLFVAEDMGKYCLGPIDDIDINFAKRVYFEPDKILEVINRYKKMYQRYIQIPVRDEMNGWFNKGNLISHACGGIVNGRRMAYSNSKEAFRYSIEKNFKLLECDVLRMENGELILGHDYRCLYEAEIEQYSIMTAEDLVNGVKENKEVNCLIDVKWKDYEEYALILEEIERLIASVAEDENEKNAIKKQIVMEVYDEKTIELAEDKKFQMIYTQYRNPDWRLFMNTAVQCHQHGIRAVAIQTASCFEMKKFLNLFTDKNIRIFAFSTDSIEEYSKLKKMGVTGVFTNYLFPNHVSIQ